MDVIWIQYVSMVDAQRGHVWRGTSSSKWRKARRTSTSVGGSQWNRLPIYSRGSFKVSSGQCDRNPQFLFRNYQIIQTSKILNWNTFLLHQPLPIATFGTPERPLWVLHLRPASPLYQKLRPERSEADGTTSPTSFVKGRMAVTQRRGGPPGRSERCGCPGNGSWRSVASESGRKPGSWARKGDGGICRECFVPSDAALASC